MGVILCLVSLTGHYCVRFVQVVACNCNLFFLIALHDSNEVIHHN